MTTEELNQLKTEAHNTAVEHGFYDTLHSKQHYMMLIITEVAEAVQADRLNNHADMDAYNKHLNQRGTETAFTDYIKGTVEDEIADITIRILDYAGYRDIPLVVHHIEKGGMRNVEFTDVAIEIVQDLCTVQYRYKLSELKRLLSTVIAEVEYWAQSMGFDLWQFVRLKMDYNKTRPTRHGKRY